MLIRPFSTLRSTDACIAGGKGASLGEMTQAGIPVPPGFVLVSDAFDAFLEHNDLKAEIETILSQVKHEEVMSIESASERIQSLIDNGEIPEGIKIEIQQALHLSLALSGQERELIQLYAVRSSATAEDGADHAWAGQLDTYLNVSPSGIPDKVRDCWASLFTPRAIFYRTEKKLHDMHISVAVVVQSMIQSESAGVAFSVHPVTENQDEIVIEGSYGLGEAVVSGEVTPDSFVVSKHLVLSSTPHPQPLSFEGEGSGHISRQELPSPGYIFDLARDFRKVSTETESQAWELLRNRQIGGYKFRRQHPFGRYVLDFYCDELGLAIEIDGSIHETQKQKIYDEQRNNFLEKSGITVLHIATSDMYNIAQVKEKLQSVIIPLSSARKRRGDRGEVITSRHISTKSRGIFKNESGENQWLTISEPKASTPIFTDERILELAQMVMHIEKHYGFPCDIEWAFADDEFYILQARPITTLKENTHRRPESYPVYWEGKKLTWVKFLERKRSPFIYFPFIEIESQRLSDICGFRFYHHLYKWSLETGTHFRVADELVRCNEHFLNFINQSDSRLKLWAQKAQEVNVLAEDWLEKMRTNQIVFSLEIFNQFYEDFIQILLYSATLPYLILSAIDAEITKGQDRNVFSEILELYEPLRNVSKYPELERDILNIWFDELGVKYGIASEYIHFLMPDEIRDLGINCIDRDILKKRKEWSVFWNDIKSNEITFSFDQDLISDIPVLHEQLSAVDAFQGTTAFPGQVKGVVRIVNSQKDVKEFNKGDILVSISTNPDLVPLMKKSGAIITDEGGIMCHAAIISRELKKPCIVGTKIATRFFTDGDMIEVDADNGIAKILPKEQNKLATLYQTQISLTEWFQNIGHKDADILRTEDNVKRERLKVLGKTIGLPFDKPTKFSPSDIIERSTEFKAYLTEHGHEKCALRLIPSEPGLPKLRMRGQTVADVVKDWFPKQDIDPEKYRAEFIPHPEKNEWATIFVVNEKGIFGEIIADGHHHLTQGFYDEKKPIMFSYDFKNWTTFPKNIDAEKYLTEMIGYIHVKDASQQDVLKKSLGAKFSHEYVMGYFETTYSEFGTWFIDYSPVLGDLYGDFSPSIPVAKNTGDVSGISGYPGKVQGKVRIVSDPWGVTLQPDEILVCDMTSPDFVQLMQQARGIITDRGGLLSHAGIIARELRKPTILATGNATQVLKDGDMIEMDPDIGIVKIL